MKVPYINEPDSRFLDPRGKLWKKTAKVRFDLSPTPVKMVEHLSPFMATSTEHGKINRLESQLAHNGSRISILISWEDETRNNEVRDLDEFIDGVAVMFPFTANANPLTMGDGDNPVNAWFWRADKQDPYDVIAHGYGSSERRPGKQLGLSVNSLYRKGRWYVVFQRLLRSGLISHPQVSFTPDKVSGISFAVWDGGNKDRSAQKSISVQWEPLEFEA